MMKCTIDINGAVWNPIDPVGGLDEEKITIRRNDESGQVVFGYASELTFTGYDAQAIRTWLIDDQYQGATRHIVVTLTDDCCNPPKAYPFIMSAMNVEWCEQDCTVTGTLTEYTEDVVAYQCVQSTLVYDDHNGFQSKPHPRVVYCNEMRPSWLQDVVLILGIIVEIVYTSLFGIIFVIAAIVNFINLIGGNLTSSNDAIQTATTWISELQNWLISCGHYHPSPYVRDYITNVCEKCGIAWTSSILYHPDYVRMVYFNAPSKKGKRENQNANYIYENRPIKSGGQFLDDLKVAFNAEWRIINGVLYFEKASYFRNETPMLRYVDLPPETTSLCWRWTNTVKPAYGDFQYTSDPVDVIGNEALPRVNDIVEWNSPSSPVQSGAKMVMPPFSAARFRMDGIERDVLYDYRNLPFFPNINKYDRALLLNNDTCWNPKLLILHPDHQGDIAFAQWNWGVSTPRAGNDQQYNYPLWFAEETSGNLYDRFYASENPRTAGFQGFDFTLETELTCDIVAAIDIDRPIELPKGNGICREIVIDYKNGKITFTGTV